MASREDGNIVRAAGLGGALLLALATLAASDGAAADEGVPDCITVEGEARYQGLGYEHWVHVRNGCQTRAVCEVWTDVTPEKHRVEVASGEQESVMTRLGSPAREFTPRARCSLED